MEHQQQDKHVVCGSCSAVMLVGTKNGNISVGQVEKEHKDEVHTLFSACCINFCHAISSAFFNKSIHVPNQNTG